MKPRAHLLAASVIAAYALTAAADAPPPLKPARMRFATESTTQPRLVPVQMHAPPVLSATPADATSGDDLLTHKWIRSASGPVSMAPVLAPQAISEHQSGWLNEKTDQDAADKITAADSRTPWRKGWLAGSVYRLEARDASASELSSSRDPWRAGLDSDPADLDREDDLYRDDNSWSARYQDTRDRAQENSWLSPGRFGTRDNARSSGNILSAPGENNLGLSAYGASDDDR